MNASSRSAPSALAATKEWMSPSTCSLLRTFSAISVNRSSFGTPAAVQLHRRDLDAFLVDLARTQRILGAADVADMADRADQRHQRAVAEHRRDHRDVEQMPGAEPRIVGDQHVAGLQRLRREFLQQRLHRARQVRLNTGMARGRVRERLAARIQQLAGEVLRLGDDQREGRAADGEPHLLDHGDEAAPHDLQRRSGSASISAASPCSIGVSA